MPNVRLDAYLEYLRAILDELWQARPMSGNPIDVILNEIHPESGKPGVVRITMLTDRVTGIRFDVRRALAGLGGLAAGGFAASESRLGEAAALIVAAAAELSGTVVHLDRMQGEILMCLYATGAARAAAVLECVRARTAVRVEPEEVSRHLTTLSLLEIVTVDGDVYRLADKMLFRFKAPQALKQWMS